MIGDKKRKKNLRDKNSYLKVLNTISTFMSVAKFGESLTK